MFWFGFAVSAGFRFGFKEDLRLRHKSSILTGCIPCRYEKEFELHSPYFSGGLRGFPYSGGENP